MPTSHPDAAADENFAEPKPFNVSPGEPARKPASQRARDAFREQPAATTPSASDRYGAPAAPATNSAAVNPFATQSTTAQPQANSEGLIESLPAASSDGSIGTGGLKTIGRGTRAVRRSNGASRLATRQPTNLKPPGNPFRSVRYRAAGFGSSPGSSGQLSDGMNNAAALDGTGKPGERALEGPQNPALTIQKFAPGEIQVGKAGEVRHPGS